MNRLIFISLMLVFVSMKVFAANDPMVSLFKFQLQMAKTGNVEAMMKLGEMYEDGVGTKQNLVQALKTYRQAWEKGAKGAAASIKRVEQEKEYGSAASKRAAKQKLAKEKAAREKLKHDKAMREKAAREKLKRDKATREKALRAKAAHNKAIKERAARETAVRERALRDKIARVKAARIRAAQENAAQKQAAKEKAATEKAAKEQAARKQAARKGKFAADPCHTPAARFISTCRKR